MAKEKFKYLVVFKKIKSDLIAGKYPPGTMLPTENELMEIYDSSKTTIRHAIKLLSDERYVEAKQGRGTVVLNFSNYNSRRKYKESVNVDIKMHTDGLGITTNVGGYIEAIRADEEIAEKLDIVKGGKVYRIECIHLVDGRAFGYNVSYFRGELFPDLERLKFRPAADFYEYLSTAYRIKITALQDRYGVAVLNGRNATKIGLMPGASVMKIKRTGISDCGIFMYGETYVRTDVYEVVITQERDVSEL